MSTAAASLKFRRTFSISDERPSASTTPPAAIGLISTRGTAPRALRACPAGSSLVQSRRRTCIASCTTPWVAGKDSGRVRWTDPSASSHASLPLCRS